MKKKQQINKHRNILYRETIFLSYMTVQENFFPTLKHKSLSCLKVKKKYHDVYQRYLTLKADIEMKSKET